MFTDKNLEHLRAIFEVYDKPFTKNIAKIYASCLSTFDEEAIEKGLRARFVYNRMDCDAKLYPTGNPHEVLPLHMFCAGCSIILLRKTSKPKCCCISGLTG